jgi:hypothetical protein
MMMMMMMMHGTFSFKNKDFFSNFALSLTYDL